MAIPYLFPAFLTLHLMALVAMAGITLADYISHATLWRSHGPDGTTRGITSFNGQVPAYRWHWRGSADLYRFWHDDPDPWGFRRTALVPH